MPTGSSGRSGRSPSPSRRHVKTTRWCRTPIDRFVLAPLEAKGIAPNGAAERRQLIRRAYFDLIGLPPTPEEVDAFHGRQFARRADRVIDRLLASPHYGERWGRHWLDLARFAESHGYEQDYDRPAAYHYRDFVIRALNEDMPYDQFRAAGRSPATNSSPTTRQALMATGFLAAGTHATQITANQVEKERYDELDDMAATVGTAMLGLTVGCARCHDHKFDPIPQDDYYRMISTFTTTVRSEMSWTCDPEANRKAKEEFDRATCAAGRPRWQVRARQSWPAGFDAMDGGRSRQLPDAKPGWCWSRNDQVGRRARRSPSRTTARIWPVARTPSSTPTRSSRDQQPRNHGRSAGSAGRSVDGPRRAGPGRQRQLRTHRLPPHGHSGRRRAAAGEVRRAKATFEQTGLPVTAAIDEDKDPAGRSIRSSARTTPPCSSWKRPSATSVAPTLTFTLKFENNTGHNIGRPRLSVITAAPAGAARRRARPHKLLAEARRRAGHARPTSGAMPIAAALLAWFRDDRSAVDCADARSSTMAQAPKPKPTKVMVTSEGVPADPFSHARGRLFRTRRFTLNAAILNQKVAEAGRVSASADRLRPMAKSIGKAIRRRASAHIVSPPRRWPIGSPIPSKGPATCWRG